MEDKKLRGNLIFFIPDKPGAVFIYQAGNTVDNVLLRQTVEHLEYNTGSKIRWVEERRVAPRDM
jgi:hypothetical protein